MLNTFTAGLLAATLSLTTIAPSQAAAEISRDDAIAGIFTLLLLGAAIHEIRDRDDDRSPRPDPVSQDWRVLPEHCLRHATRRNGNTIRFFAQRCLNNRYDHVNRLPEQCHVRFRTDEGQRRQGYRARCMRDAGFRTSRH